MNVSALRTLEQIQEFLAGTSDLVFSVPTDVAQKALGLAQYTARHAKGEKPVQDPVEVPWTVHDLRRTVATGLAKLGCPRVVQDRILNHVDTSVSAIYDRYQYDGEARSWLQKGRITWTR